MLHFFKKYLFFLTAGLLLTPAAPGQLTAEDGMLYLLKYEDAAVSPRAKLVILTERLRRQVRQSIPGGKNQSVREIFVLFADGRKFKPFTHQLDRQNNLRIILPPSYPVLLAEPDALPRLTGWYLFGRAAKNPDLEKYCRNSWFTVGLTRKVMEEMTPVNMPFSSYFPAAYTLTSAARYPTLQSLLEVQLLPEDTTARLVYEEYCELLYLICARSGLFKAGLLTRILEGIEQSPERNDMPEQFRTLARPFLEKREPELFPPGLDRKQLAAAFERWFQRELDNLLNQKFLPASAGKIEMIYLRTVRFNAPLKRNSQTETPSEIQGNLTDLVRNYTRLAEPDATAKKILDGLNRLVLQASPDLKIPLDDVRNALQTFAAAPVPANGEQLLQMEQQLFKALERNLSLADFLDRTEQECIPPVLRYYLTFQVIGYGRRPAAQPLPRLAALLDRTEKEWRK